MKTGIIAALALIWIVGVIFNSTYDMEVGDDWNPVENETKLEYLTNLDNMSIEHSQIGEFQVPMPNKNWWKTIAEMLVLRFSFMEGPGYNLVWLFIFFPISVVGIATVIYMFIQLGQGILSWFT